MLRPLLRRLPRQGVKQPQPGKAAAQGNFDDPVRENDEKPLVPFMYHHDSLNKTTRAAHGENPCAARHQFVFAICLWICFNVSAGNSVRSPVAVTSSVSNAMTSISAGSYTSFSIMLSSITGSVYVNRWDELFCTHPLPESTRRSPPQRSAQRIRGRLWSYNSSVPYEHTRAPRARRSPCRRLPW